MAPGTKDQYFQTIVSFKPRVATSIFAEQVFTHDKTCRDADKQIVLISGEALVAASTRIPSTEFNEFELDLDIVSHRFTLFTEAAVQDWNARKACNLSGWRLGIARDVTLETGSKDVPVSEACTKSLASFLRKYEIIRIAKDLSTFEVGIKSTLDDAKLPVVYGMTPQTRPPKFGTGFSRVNSGIESDPVVSNREGLLSQASIDIRTQENVVVGEDFQTKISVRNNSLRRFPNLRLKVLLSENLLHRFGNDIFVDIPGLEPNQSFEAHLMARPALPGLARMRLLLEHPEGFKKLVEHSIQIGGNVDPDRRPVNRSRPPTPMPLTFTKDIRPLAIQYCASTCHTPDAEMGDPSQYSFWTGKQQYSKDLVESVLVERRMPAEAGDNHPIDALRSDGTSHRAVILKWLQDPKEF